MLVAWRTFLLSPFYRTQTVAAAAVRAELRMPFPGSIIGPPDVVGVGLRFYRDSSSISNLLSSCLLYTSDAADE